MSTARKRRVRAASDMGTIMPMRGTESRGRNDPCGCRSGKKYKRCCMSRKNSDAVMQNIGAAFGIADDEDIERVSAIHTKPKPVAKPTPAPKPKKRKPKKQPETPSTQKVTGEDMDSMSKSSKSSKSSRTNAGLADIEWHPTRTPQGGIVRITPAIARAWLEEKNYEDNRPISGTRVQFYARQMATDRWRMNGEPIIFDTEDMLLNGQHRLKAIIESGKTIEVFVIRGISQDAFTTMDQGYTRTGGQVLCMKGLKNASTRAAICRAMYVWEVSNGMLTKLSRKVSPDELLLVQECYPEEVEEAVVYSDIVRREVPMSCGMIGLGHILVKRARPRKAGEFLQVLANGLTTSKGHPALVLRNRFIKDKMQDRTLPPEAQFAAFIRAWNSYDQGKTLRSVLVKRNPDGEWVTQAIRGLGRKRTGGEITS